MDFRYAVRMLLKNPGFTIVAVLTLALAIGANTAIFSVVRGVLLDPLPFADPGALVAIWETDLHNNSPREGASAPDYIDFKSAAKSFSQMAASQYVDQNLTESTMTPERVNSHAVTYDFFSTVGIRPALGRSFVAEDDIIGAERVTVLEHSFWQRRYGGDAGVIGRAISLDGVPHTIVGVMPEGFTFRRDGALWIPLIPYLDKFREYRGMHGLFVLGRLAPGVSIGQAQAEMTAIAANMEKQYPVDNIGRGVFLEPLHEAVVGNVRRPVMVLFGAVVMVLLIACANVAGLYIARSNARAREVAIRTSLGASRPRLMRQLLTESTLLGFLGGLIGLGLAVWLVRLVTAMSAETLPRSGNIQIDPFVLAFTMAVSLAAGILAGLLPAIQGSRSSPAGSLKKQSGAIAGRIRSRARVALVVSEVALAVLLVIGSGLLMRSFWRLLRVNPGFRAENVLVVDLNLPESKYPSPGRETYPRWPEMESFTDRMLENVQRIPGVKSTALALNHPLRAGWTTQFNVVGRPQTPGPVDEVRIRPISPDYLATVGVPLLRGRNVLATDRNDGPGVLLVNEAFVRRYFPGEDPIGRRVNFWGREKEIVGVIGDVRFRGLNRASEPAFYPPFAQMPMGRFSILVHTETEPLSVFPAVRDAVWSMDRDLAIQDVNTLENILAESVGTPRFQMLLLGLFGALALLLAAIGIYGIVSYQVEQRTREIGVRLALGARYGQIVNLVVGEGAALAAAGIGIGLAVAVTLTHFMRSMLFEVGERDLGTYLAVAALLALVAIAASYLPARRITRVDPVVALRYE